MDDSEPVQLPRGIALAWGVAANPQRGPKREMSVERIVETAVELADAEGLGAVSMAAVAKRLGFTPMSLYRYVSAKDALPLLMQEEATGPPSGDFREVDGWREKLLVLFREQVGVFIRHPWLLSLPISGSPVTPNGSLWVEAGLTARSRGFPSRATSASRSSSPSAGARAGTAWWSRGTRIRSGARAVGAGDRRAGERIVRRDGHEYPRLRAAIDAGVFVSEHDPFRFGSTGCSTASPRTSPACESGAPAALVPEWAEPDDADVADDKRYRTAVKATAEAEKGVRQAEKLLRQARKQQRLALREARGACDARLEEDNGS